MVSISKNNVYLQGTAGCFWFFLSLTWTWDDRTHLRWFKWTPLNKKTQGTIFCAQKSPKKQLTQSASQVPDREFQYSSFHVWNMIISYFVFLELVFWFIICYFMFVFIHLFLFVCLCFWIQIPLCILQSFVAMYIQYINIFYI